jgi:2-oxoglutarate dehydrogenase E2 component (dihydrolipoamide succinyltransferase)
VGDKVDRDEPLFEISTDKVDAEIPSPAAGVVAEIRVQEGETVPVNSVVAVIGAAAGMAASPAPSASAPAPAPPLRGPQPSPVTAPPPQPRPEPGAPVRAPEPSKPAARGDGAASALSSAQPETDLRIRSSPLVRRIAKDHNVDISLIQGSGIGGRVTKDDILAFIERQGQGASAAPAPKTTGPAAVAAFPEPAAASGAPSPIERGPAAVGDEIVRMSPMRKRIAEHMVLSRRTSAHVHSVFEVNFTRLAQIREARKAEFERAGTRITYMSFITKAVVDALREVPIVNASVDGDTIVYHKAINIGVAVALDWGLIVPVIKHADEKNLLGLSRAIVDLASRARAKQLKPEEVSGGTFTITNPGVFGALFGTPIINQPQVAILGVGNVEKRPVVVDDAIAIRTMAYLTLGYDHRVIDGAVADQFMSHVKRALESWDPGAV